jgi:hypothetical protein
MTIELRSVKNGKGDNPRPYSPRVYGENYDRIFKKKKATPKPNKK